MVQKILLTNIFRFKQVLLLVLLLIFVASVLRSNEISDYFLEYAKKGVSDYNKEQVIIKKYSFEILVNILNRYYTDTLPAVRQKAFYLTFKRSAIEPTARKQAVYILLKGCNDKDGGIIGQNVGYLKNSRLIDFSDESVQIVNQKITNHRTPYYNDFLLLAGFLGTGKDIIFQKMLDENISVKTKWYCSLALARMGNAEQIKSCLYRAKNMPVNDKLIEYIIPDLIYIRQKEAIDFCVEILNSKEELCHSLDPDNYRSVHCGYRLLEMLAPVINNFPVTIDATGIVGGQPDNILLDKVRKWFVDNPNYHLNKDMF